MYASRNYGTLVTSLNFGDIVKIMVFRYLNLIVIAPTPYDTVLELYLGQPELTEAQAAVSLRNSCLFSI